MIFQKPNNAHFLIKKKIMHGLGMHKIKYSKFLDAISIKLNIWEMEWVNNIFFFNLS